MQETVGHLNSIISMNYTLFPSNNNKKKGNHDNFDSIYFLIGNVLFPTLLGHLVIKNKTDSYLLL